MKNVDAHVEIVISDKETGKTETSHFKYRDLYAYNNQVRIPKIVVPITKDGEQ